MHENISLYDIMILGCGIVKVKINKIFGKYNYEIDFNKKINILIGENGIGKSTIIKIVNCILNYNYIGLIKYYFDSIEIIDENENITINYNDLAISNNYLVKKYVGDKDYDIYEEVKKDYDTAKEKNPSLDLDLISTNDFGSNEEKIAYEILYNNYSFEEFLNKIDNRLLYKILKFNEKLLFNEKLILSYEIISSPGESSTFLKFIKETYNSAEKNNSDGIYFINSNIANMHKKIKQIIDKMKYNSVLLIDMSTDFNVVNDFNRQYASNVLEIDAMSNEYKESLEFNKQESNPLKWKFIPFKDKFPNLKNEEFIKKLKCNYKVNRTGGFDGRNLDFGNYLFNQIYDSKLIDEFKNDLYDFLHENMSNVESLKKYRKVKDSTFNKLRFYIKPLLDKNNIFFSKLIENWNVDYYADDTEEFVLLTAFYQKYKDKYVEIKNHKLIRLNDLLKKYFVNKQVVATPFGISISTSDFANDIYFEELSAGEKKIIILLTIAIFSEDIFIMLDEPEASLSIVWQEQLIPDLLENVNFNRLLIATQSPYIIESEDLDEYIIPLIDGDQNE